MTQSVTKARQLTAIHVHFKLEMVEWNGGASRLRWLNGYGGASRLRWYEGASGLNGMEVLQG